MFPGLNLNFSLTAQDESSLRAESPLVPTLNLNNNENTSILNNNFIPTFWNNNEQININNTAIVNNIGFISFQELMKLPFDSMIPMNSKKFVTVSTENGSYLLSFPASLATALFPQQADPLVLNKVAQPQLTGSLVSAPPMNPNAQTLSSEKTSNTNRVENLGACLPINTNPSTTSCSNDVFSVENKDRNPTVLAKFMETLVKPLAKNPVEEKYFFRATIDEFDVKTLILKRNNQLNNWSFELLNGSTGMRVDKFSIEQNTKVIDPLGTRFSTQLKTGIKLIAYVKSEHSEWGIKGKIVGKNSLKTNPLESAIGKIVVSRCKTVAQMKLECNMTFSIPTFVSSYEDGKQCIEIIAVKDAVEVFKLTSPELDIFSKAVFYKRNKEQKVNAAVDSNINDSKKMKFTRVKSTGAEPTSVPNATDNEEDASARASSSTASTPPRTPTPPTSPRSPTLIRSPSPSSSFTDSD